MYMDTMMMAMLVEMSVEDKHVVGKDAQS